MIHPEYLFNEGNEEEYVLVAEETPTVEAAKAWLIDYTGGDYDEIELVGPVYLRPSETDDDIPSGWEGYCEVGEWYCSTDAEDPRAVAYWKTEL